MKTKRRRYIKNKHSRFILTRTGNREFVRDKKGRILASYRVKANGDIVKADAKRLFASRKRISRLIDKRRNAKATLSGTGYSPDKRRLRAKWFVHPNASDIQGVDTRNGAHKNGARPKRRKRRAGFGRTRSSRM